MQIASKKHTIKHADAEKNTPTINFKNYAFTAAFGVLSEEEKTSLQQVKSEICIKISENSHFT